jgi:hypothetical protein
VKFEFDLAIPVMVLSTTGIPLSSLLLSQDIVKKVKEIIATTILSLDKIFIIFGFKLLFCF